MLYLNPIALTPGVEGEEQEATAKGSIIRESVTLITKCHKTALAQFFTLYNIGFHKIFDLRAPNGFSSKPSLMDEPMMISLMGLTTLSTSKPDQPIRS